eukprot:jgi/Mesvir1/23192/Mv24231-RA.1
MPRLRAGIAAAADVGAGFASTASRHASHAVRRKRHALCSPALLATSSRHRPSDLGAMGSDTSAARESTHDSPSKEVMKGHTCSGAVDNNKGGAGQPLEVGLQQSRYLWPLDGCRCRRGQESQGKKHVMVLLLKPGPAVQWAASTGPQRGIVPSDTPTPARNKYQNASVLHPAIHAMVNASENPRWSMLGVADQERVTESSATGIPGARANPITSALQRLFLRTYRSPFLLGRRRPYCGIKSSCARANNTFLKSPEENSEENLDANHTKNSAADVGTAPGCLSIQRDNDMCKWPSNNISITICTLESAPQTITSATTHGTPWTAHDSWFTDHLNRENLQLSISQALVTCCCCGNSSYNTPARDIFR